MKCIRTIERGCIFELQLKSEGSKITSVTLDKDQSVVGITHMGDPGSREVLVEEVPSYSCLAVNNTMLLVKLENLRKGEIRAVHIETDDGCKYDAEDVKVEVGV